MAQYNVFHGSRGWATIGANDLLNLTDWTCEVTGDTARATPMAITAGAGTSDFAWSQHEKGFVRWTAAANGYIIGTGSDFGITDDGSDVGTFAAGDSDITHQTPITLNLYFASDAALGYLTGDAFITGMSFNASSGDIETLGYTFQGTDALTFAI